MFFLTNHLRATLPEKVWQFGTGNFTHAMRKASFMVNKTSTIKRIFGSGLNFPEAATLKSRVQKCEVDVQMLRTPVLQQAFDYAMFCGFLPVWRTLESKDWHCSRPEATRLTGIVHLRNAIIFIAACARFYWATALKHA